MTTKWTMKSNHGSTNQGHNGIEHFMFKLLYANGKTVVIICLHIHVLESTNLLRKSLSNTSGKISKYMRVSFTCPKQSESSKTDCILILACKSFLNKRVHCKIWQEKKRVGYQNEHG